MRTRSLRFRLLAGILLSELVLAAGLVWAGVEFTHRQLRVAFDAGLRGRLMSVAALVRYPEVGHDLVFDPTLVPPAEHPRRPSFYQVLAPGGTVVASTFPAGVAVPPPGATRRQFWNFSYHGIPYRGLRLANMPILDTEENLTAAPGQLTVAYAAPTLDMQGEVAGAGVAIGATSLALLALALWLAAWLTRRELEPLRLLARQAAEISPRNWRFQPEPALAATQELQPLVEALDRMLTRLQTAHQQQREFLADAAHHLKTPVAILKSTWQSLLQRPREREEYVAAGQASLQDVERLERLLQRMLRLARAEQEPPLPPFTPVGPSCRAAIERVMPLARGRGVELQASGLDTPASLRADPDDLELVWLNLLENAVEAAPRGSTVAIACTAAAAPGQVEVSVRDQGPGVPAADRPHIFERFRRGGNAPAGGFGLGLAIARAVVVGYGGSIAIEDAPPPGACFRVRLPLGA